MAYTYKYPRPAVTADCIVITREAEPKVLLIQRGNPLIASHFLVYSGPTVLLLMDGKEVYRGSQFIDLEELQYNINRYIELIGL